MGSGMRLFCNLLDPIRSTNNKVYLNFAYKRGHTSVCTTYAKENTVWSLTVEILNKFLHISCLALFLLFLLHLQLDTVFSHTHLFTMSTSRGAGGECEKPWQAQSLLLSEKPRMKSPQAMKFACNFQHNENGEK